MTTNILSYLEDSAHKFADKTAIADDKNSLTFSQWNRYSRNIGTAIINASGGAVRKPVLVFVDRRIEGLVGFMGVTRSGNFYVPIDCKMPDQRVKLIADVLDPIAAITVTTKDEKTLDLIDFKGTRFCYEDVINTHADDDKLAEIRGQMIDTDPVYSIFTSGSTGVPKGVVIAQRGMVDLAEWLVNTFNFTSEDALGNQTPFYFDGSVKDICICLKSGATLNVIGKKYFTFPKTLIPFLNDRKITSCLWATSAIVLVGNSDILSVALPKHLRIVTFAGEAMPAKQLKVWMNKLPDTTFVNLYGPTEITVDCTYYVVDREFGDDEFIPIGKHCDNKQVLVLNDDNQLVDVGEPGELCVRGTGVALGYYNNPEKTKEAFVQNPLNSFYEDKIYRTGDIVKYNGRGELEFVSRKDFQIKHKGNRIEMGEIEVAVNSIPEVTNAVCVFDQPNDKIVLYYTTVDGQELDIINLVKDKIPVYMFPEVVNMLKTMPYNMNGKIDRIELKKVYEGKLKETKKSISNIGLTLTTGKEEIESLINDFSASKHKWQNYFGIDLTDTEAAYGGDNLFLKKQYNGFCRIYIMANGESILTDYLSILPCNHIINIPSRVGIDIWTPILEKNKFRQIATYSRYVYSNYRKGNDKNLVFATVEDLEHINNELHHFFSPLTGHLPNIEELLKMIEEKRIVVNRNTEGKVEGALCYQIKGKKAELPFWFDRSGDGLSLLFNVFYLCHCAEVRQIVFWVNDENINTISIHKMLGAKADGLVDYIFNKE